ncbi:MAG: CHAT domain-containing tetratricopeptide repeat protein, partial [Acidobacteriota bacterium]
FHPPDDESASGGALRRRAEAFLSEAAALPLDAEAGVLRQAAELYTLATTEFAQIDDRRQEARALLSAANYYRVLGDAEQAFSHYDAARGHWLVLGNQGFVADALVGLGQAARQLDRPLDARNHLQAAAEIYGDLGRSPELASSLGNLGLLAQMLGNFDDALQHYEVALAEQRRAGQQFEIAALLLNIGSTQSRLGDAESALANQQRGLELFRQLGDRRMERIALNNLAVLHRRLGEHEEAFRLYNESQSLAAELGDRRAEAQAINNRGYSYFALGDLERASQDFRRALDLRRQLGDASGELNSLTNLGSVLYHRGDFSSARGHLEAALALARDRQSPRRVGVLGILGRLLARLGDRSATDLFAEAHRLVSQREDPLVEAELAFRHGEALHFLGDQPGSRAALAHALDLWTRYDSGPERVQALAALGKTEQARGRFAVARQHLAQALQLIESLRTGIESPDLRAVFQSSTHRVPALLTEVLMRLHRDQPDAGHDRQALAIAERFRARRLLDLLIEAEVDLAAGVDPEVVAEHRGLIRRLSLLVRRQQQIALGRESLLTQQARDDLVAEMAEIRAAIDLTEVEMRQRNPRRASLNPAETPTAESMQRMLEPGTLLLYYALGEERSYLWLVTTSRIHSFELSPKAVIETAARQFHHQLSTLQPLSGSLSRRLGEMLLGPSAPLLQGPESTTRRLVVIADGALHYIPFAALTLPQGRESPAASRVEDVAVVERFEVVHLPSAAILEANRRGATGLERPPHVAVFADPVFDRLDPRLLGTPGTLQSPLEPNIAEVRGPRESDDWTTSTDGGELIELGRLPGSRIEARAIAERLPPGQRLIALGFEANRSALDADLRQSTIVHFATHASIDTEHPRLSALLLSQYHADGRRRIDGSLRLHDIYNLDLEAELVVVSGCRTALGRELRGEGLQGLTTGFFHAGAERVMASLWSVADRATAELMRHFYRELLDNGQRPAAALR